MGPTARSRLEAPYEAADPLQRVNELGERLGVPLRECNLLASAIDDSLTICREKGGPLGALSRRKRVLVSDVMLQAARSVNSNLLETALHRMDFADAVEQAQRAKEFRIQFDDARRPRHSRTNSPLEDVADTPVDMHLAGFLRAAGAALDCLGIVAIGVLGLSTPILRGSLADVSERKLRRSKDPSPESFAHGRPHSRQLASIQHLQRAVGSAGPPDWKAWAMAMRHTYVHRPRRMTLMQATPYPLRLLSPTGSPILRTRFDLVLPRDPSRGDMDEFGERRSLDALVLSERADTTIDGVLASLGKTVDTFARRLRRTWQLRMRRPDLIVQPTAQWDNKASESSVDFAGYRPGSFLFRADQIMIATSQMPRFVGSGVLDHERGLWDGGE